MINDTNLLLDLVAIMLTVTYLFKLAIEGNAGRGLSIRQKLWSICRTPKRSLNRQHIVAKVR